PCGTPVFKTGAIDHSATPPGNGRRRGSVGGGRRAINDPARSARTDEAAELAQRRLLDLPDAVARHAERLAEVLDRRDLAVAGKAIVGGHDAALLLVEPRQEVLELVALADEAEPVVPLGEF